MGNPYLHDPRGPGSQKTMFVFDTLLTEDLKGKVQLLAKEWKINDKEYTFILNDNIKWHDGKPLTANDVAFTIDYQIKHPPVSARLGNLKKNIIDSRTVPALVFALIYVPFGVHFIKNLLNAAHMSFFRGSDKIVVGDFHGPPEFFYPRNHFIDIFLRRYALLVGNLLYLKSVFICSRQEVNIVARKSLEPCHGVRHYGAIRVSYVQVGTRIIYRRGNVIRSFACLCICHNVIPLIPFLKSRPRRGIVNA